MRRRRTTSILIALAFAISSVTGYFVVHHEAPSSSSVTNPKKFYEIPATQVFRYQAVRTTNDSWGKTRHLKGNMHLIRTKMSKFSGRFQLESPGGEWGAKRTLHKTLHHLHDALHDSRVGRVWKIRPTQHRKVVWKSRKTDIDPAKVLNTEGTFPIDIIVGSTLKKFPNIRVIGIYVCKYILGTYTLSQHAYGNAVDWGGSTDLLGRVARWQYWMYQKHWLPISQLLWQGRDWISGSGVYDHYDHVHDSGYPMLHYSSCVRPGNNNLTPAQYTPTAPLEGEK